MLIFYTVATLIVLVLSAVAGYYVWALVRQQRRIKKLTEAQEQERLAQRQRVNNSIQHLARGLVAEQLTLTEGAIRISVLLESLSVEDAIKQEYKAFYLLAEKTAHIPILENWKKLPTKDKLKFDQQRQQLEQEFGDFVIDAAERIQTRVF